MTPEQVSALSDTELNRAMLDSFMPYWAEDKDIIKGVQKGKFNYLEDWNITMPLAVEHNLQIDLYQNSKTGEVTAFSVMGHFAGIDKNPLRAICECLVLIALADHS